MPVKKKITITKKQVTNKKTETIKVTKPVVVKAPKAGGLFVPVYSLAGRTSGTMSLPKEVFDQVVNEKLLAQAVRVYSTNQKFFNASTKTRGEVQGSTAKIWRQKGTGRARHGAIRAPIFIGGGIAFGPTPRKVTLDLPKKMKKAALFSALSSKVSEKRIIGLSGLEKATGKTKEMAKLVNSLSLIVNGKDKKQNKINALIVTAEKIDNIVRETRNIPGVDVLPANLVNAYEILKHDILFLTKDAVDVLSGKGKAKG